MTKFSVGDEVQKIGGDYRFEGTVMSIFNKKSGLIRLVVEDDRGLLFIFNENNLVARNNSNTSVINQ